MDIRRRTAVISAYKFSGDSHRPNWPSGWLDVDHKYIMKENHDELSIIGMQGKWMYATKGDWIVKDEKGIFTSYKPAKFRKEFMPA